MFHVVKLLVRLIGKRKEKNSPDYERVIVHVIVSWSLVARVTDVKVFSASIVPDEDAVNNPPACADCEPDAVNVLLTVYVLWPFVCAYVPCALDRPFAIISPDSVVSPAAGVIAVFVSAM